MADLFILASVIALVVLAIFIVSFVIKSSSKILNHLLLLNTVIFGNIAVNHGPTR